MDPIPPPEQSQSSDRVAGLVMTISLFGLSMLVNCLTRERQTEQIRRQADELREIRAMLEERGKHEESRHQGRR